MVMIVVKIMTLVKISRPEGHFTTEGRDHD